MNQNVTARRGALISGIAALALLVFVAAFDNQWTRHWRESQIGKMLDGGAASWYGMPINAASVLNWRATPATGESTRFFSATLTSTVLALVFAWLLMWLVCRGVGGVRGRVALFLGGWFATGLGAALALVIGTLISGKGHPILGGDGDNSLTKGITYDLVINAGGLFGLYVGWLVGLVAVLVYNITPGMDDISAASGYPSPTGYDYGSATPTDYSVTPTSPYSPGGGYGNEGGNGETTQTMPNDPYDGRTY